MWARLCFKLSSVKALLYSLYIDLLTTLSFPHNMVNCKKPCTKPRECGHKCTEVCYLPCHCACAADRGRSSPRKSSPGRSSPQSRHRPPLDPALLTAKSQAFRDFASGGHVQADATLVTMAANSMSQLRLQKADHDMASALFGKDSAAEPRDPTLTKVSSVPNGATRGVWTSVYEGRAVNGDEEAKGEDGQPSLLD